MKYYLRQRIFAFADTYDITDENKQPLYRVKSRLFSFGSKISLRDLNDVEQFFINQKIFHFFPHYQIEKMVKQLAWSNANLASFLSMNWKVYLEILLLKGISLLGISSLPITVEPWHRYIRNSSH